MENQTNKNIAITKTKLLLVEGNHERDFFNAWLKVLARDDIQVIVMGGKDQFRRKLKIFIKDHNFSHVKSIVVVRDADNNPKSALQSVQDALSDINLPTPSDALVFTQETTPKVGIIIVPALNQTGALEELVMQTVVNDYPLAVKAIQFIDEAVTTLSQATSIRPPPLPHKQGEAKVHAFLATFKEPDKDLGKAALGGVWNFQHQYDTILIHFLNHQILLILLDVLNTHLFVFFLNMLS